MIGRNLILIFIAAVPLAAMSCSHPQANKRPATTQGWLDTVSDAASSDEDAEKAISHLRFPGMDIPTSFWVKIANSDQYSQNRRFCAVLQIFDSIKPGTTLSEMGRILDGAKWFRVEMFRVDKSYGGMQMWVAPEGGHQIALGPGIPMGDTSEIMLGFDGQIDPQKEVEVLSGQKHSEADNERFAGVAYYISEHHNPEPLLSHSKWPIQCDIEWQIPKEQITGEPTTRPHTLQGWQDTISDPQTSDGQAEQAIGELRGSGAALPNHFWAAISNGAQYTDRRRLWAVLQIVDSMPANATLGDLGHALEGARWYQATAVLDFTGLNPTQGLNFNPEALGSITTKLVGGTNHGYAWWFNMPLWDRTCVTLVIEGQPHGEAVADVIHGYDRAASKLKIKEIGINSGCQDDSSLVLKNPHHTVFGAGEQGNSFVIWK